MKKRKAIRAGRDEALRFYLIIEPVFPGAMRREVIGVVAASSHAQAMDKAREDGIITDKNPDATSELAEKSDVDRFMDETQALINRANKRLIGFRNVKTYADKVIYDTQD